MRAGPAKVAATLVAAACLAAISVAAILDARGGYSAWSGLPASSSAALCGWLLAVRRPSNPVGWLLLLGSVGMVGMFSAGSLANWALRHPGTPGTNVLVLAAGISFIPLVTALPLLLPLVFPTGHLLGRRWRVAVAADLGYGTFALANIWLVQPVTVDGFGDVPNPYAVPALAGPLKVALGGSAACLAIGGVSSIAATVLRYRRASGVERQQIKWVAYTLVMLPLPFAGYGILPAAVDQAAIVVVLAFLPISILIAVSRYRLYDIDRIISRTLSYVLLTATVVAVYVGAVTLATQVLPLHSTYAVAAATLAAVAAANPLRRRLQSAVDRRFNRARYDATRTVEAFADRLRTEVNLNDVRTDLLTAVHHTVQPTHATLWLRART